MSKTKWTLSASITRKLITMGTWANVGTTTPAHGRTQTIVITPKQKPQANPLARHGFPLAAQPDFAAASEKPPLGGTPDGQPPPADKPPPAKKSPERVRPRLGLGDGGRRSTGPRRRRIWRRPPGFRRRHSGAGRLRPPRAGGRGPRRLQTAPSSSPNEGGEILQTGGGLGLRRQPDNGGLHGGFRPLSLRSGIFWPLRSP